MLELLKDRVYIRYWLSVVVSFLGDAMTRVTLIWVAADITDSPIMIALVVFAQLMPSGVLGAFVGPLADRFSKRSLMVGSDLARLVIVLAMIPFLDSIWALLALALLEGVGKAFFETARIAAVPDIVRGHSIPTAVALFQSTNHTVNLVGPAVGGLLIGIGSASAVLVIDSATFAVSALLLGSLTILKGRVSAAPAQSYWQSLRTGIRGVLAVPSLRFVFIFLIPVTVVFGLFTTNINAQLLTVFDLTATRFGVAMAVFAGGSVAGALIGPALIKRYRSPEALMVIAVAVFGITMLALGPTQWLEDELGFAIVLVWCAATGVFASLYQVPVANTLLRDLPEDMRGRGVGLMHAITVNLTVLGVIIGGSAASLFGTAGSIIVAGGVLLLSNALFIVPVTRAAQRDEVPDEA